jgi:hypothetical protein
MKREMRDILRAAKLAGAVIRGGGASHYVMRFPNGRTVTMSASPSDRRFAMQARGDIARAMKGSE